MSRVGPESEKEREKRLQKQAKALKLIKPLSQKQLNALREAVNKIKAQHPGIKKIHRFGKNPAKVLKDELIFQTEDMRRSVIFGEDGRAYIVHKVKNVEVGAYGRKKEVHYAGAGGYGEFRILQDLETGEFTEGVKIQKKIIKTASYDKTPYESQTTRHLKMAVTNLEREQVGPPKRYEIMRRIAGNDLGEIIFKKELSEKDKPYMALAVIFEAMNLHRMGICHRDLKENNMLCRKAGEGSKVWIAEAIDFGFARRVNPEKEGSLSISAGGTTGYSDRSKGQIPNIDVLQIDSYSVARIIFNIFIEDGMGPDYDLPRTPTAPLTGFDTRKVSAIMIRKGKIEENVIVQGLANPDIKRRFTTRKAFLEMAKLYPEETYEFLAMKLEMERQAIPDKSLPYYLRKDETLKNALIELNIPVPKPASRDTESTEEMVDQYLYLHNKASLLNGLINVAKKYEKAFEFLGITDDIKSRILQVAGKSQKEFTVDYVYKTHSYLFHMIDGGDLVQQLALELADPSISAERREEYKKKVYPIVYNLAKKSSYTDSDYSEIKNKIIAMTKEVQREIIQIKEGRQAQSLSHGEILTQYGIRAHTETPVVQEQDTKSAPSATRDDVMKIVNRIIENCNFVEKFKNSYAETKPPDKVNSQKKVAAAIGDMTKDLNTLKQGLKKVDSEPSEFQDLKKALRKILDEGRTTFLTARSIRTFMAERDKPKEAPPTGPGKDSGMHP